jgi:hypothetical protein
MFWIDAEYYRRLSEIQAEIRQAFTSSAIKNSHSLLREILLRVKNRTIHTPLFITARKNP